MFDFKLYYLLYPYQHNEISKWIWDTPFCNRLCDYVCGKSRYWLIIRHIKWSECRNPKNHTIFLISVPFVSINRITTASFYATEKSIFSYILSFVEPIFMLILMLILPTLFGGQIMIWWSTVFARILSAILALILKQHAYEKEILVSANNEYW